MDASPLSAWENFYVIVGSSAGALTGLQFVVLTLIAESGMARNRGDLLSAFGSPNVVHFCAALLVGAILSAPWPGLTGAGITVAICGLAGVGYAVNVIRRMRQVYGRGPRPSSYQPVFEDWLWTAILPVLAYATLLVAGLTLAPHPEGALFASAGAALLLVFIGIRNAWDTVMYVTTRPRPRARDPHAGARTADPTPTAPSPSAAGHERS